MHCNTKKLSTFSDNFKLFILPLPRNPRPDGGIGRHEGLKIPWPVMAVRVRFPFRAQEHLDTFTDQLTSDNSRYETATFLE